MNAINKKILFLKELSKDFSLSLQTAGYAVFLRSEYQTKITVELPSADLLSLDHFNVFTCLENVVFISSLPCKRRFEISLDGTFEENANVSICIFTGGVPIFYGQNKNPLFDLKGLINYAKKEYDKKIKNSDCEKKSCFDDSEEKCDYNDELIATENYYKNLGKNYEQELPLQNEIAYCEDKAEKVESFKENQTFFNEEDYYERQENCYLKIKDKLNNLLNSHQEFNELNSVFDESKFVKIQYDDTRFYIVGAIYEKGDIKYVCYGVKGEYNSMPKELDGYCRFVPKNCFDLYGDGYYLIFQDAKNGKIIT